MYTFDQLKQDVAKEAEALRKHATKEELERLDFSSFDPCAVTNCIYGLMTGSCFSQRAEQLIRSCATRCVKDEAISCTRHHGFERIRQRVIDITTESFYNRTGSINEEAYYSAIEAYAFLPEAKNANLIAYLKGETETLEL